VLNVRINRMYVDGRGEQSWLVWYATEATKEVYMAEHFALTPDTYDLDAVFGCAIGTFFRPMNYVNPKTPVLCGGSDPV
jgi:hypothetical protein